MSGSRIQAGREVSWRAPSVKDWKSQFPERFWFPLLTGHNQFLQISGGNRGNIMLITCALQTSLWLSLGPQPILYYEKKESTKPRKILEMEEVEIPWYSVFIGYGSLHHANDTCTRDHDLLYHTYVIPEGRTRKTLLPPRMVYPLCWKLDSFATMMENEFHTIRLMLVQSRVLGTTM